VYVREGECECVSLIQCSPLDYFLFLVSQNGSWLDAPVGMLGNAMSVSNPDPQLQRKKKIKAKRNQSRNAKKKRKSEKKRFFGDSRRWMKQQLKWKRTKRREGIRLPRASEEGD
jgi:hypothetical protein